MLIVIWYWLSTQSDCEWESSTTNFTRHLMRAKKQLIFLWWVLMTSDPTIMGKSEKMRVRTRVWAQAPKPSSFAKQMFSTVRTIIGVSRKHFWKFRKFFIVWNVTGVDFYKIKLGEVFSVKPFVKSWKHEKICFLSQQFCCSKKQRDVTPFWQ